MAAYCFWGASCHHADKPIRGSGRSKHNQEMAQGTGRWGHTDVRETPVWATSDPLGLCPYSSHRYRDQHREDRICDMCYPQSPCGCTEFTFSPEASFWWDTCGSCSALPCATHQCERSQHPWAMLDEFRREPMNLCLPLLSPGRTVLRCPGRLSWRSHNSSSSFPSCQASFAAFPFQCCS